MSLIHKKYPANYYARVLFTDIPRIARAVSDSRRGELYLIVQLWFFVISRKVLKLLGPATFSFVYHGKTFPFTLRAPMDIAVLREVFGDREYEWSPPDPRIIIDLGAHIGDTAVYYACRFPEAKIIAVEPSQKNFDLLKQNVAQFKNVIPVLAAATDQDGVAHMDETGSPLGYAVSNDRAGRMVQTYTLPTLLRTHGAAVADLVKFDIEGAEFDALIAETIHASHAYIGELHFDRSPAHRPDAFRKMFEEAGFSSTLVPLEQTGRYIFTATRS